MNDLLPILLYYVNSFTCDKKYHKNKPMIPKCNCTCDELANNCGFITEEVDPTVPSWVKNITLQDIINWNNNSVNPKYGEMYQFNNLIVTDQDNNVYNAINNYNVGLFNGFTFKSGTSANIISVSSYLPGRVLITTSTPHNLLSGEPVTQIGTTDYNGTFIVTVVSPTTYSILHAFTITKTGTVTRGSTLKANTGSGGNYQLSFSNTIIPTTSNNIFEVIAYKNDIKLTNITGTRRISNANDVSEINSTGLVTIGDNDYIWLAIENQTNSVGINVNNSNLNLHKI